MPGDKDLIVMKVTGLTMDPFTSMPIVILKDVEEKYALPIWIGLIEASAIATELEKIKLSRPMTHDLIKNIMESAGVSVVKVIVSDLNDNTFYAQIYLKSEQKEWMCDARPSDAIALALRTQAPILVSKGVIEKTRRLDLTKEVLDKSAAKQQKWSEILENLTPEDFGKYKM